MARYIIALLMAFSMLGMHAGASQALADDYPSGPLDVILPFKAGGGTDTSMRLLQKPLEKRLGQRLNFIYKPGAGGVMGYMAVSKSKPDGYTIGAVNWPHVLVPQIVKENPGYKLEDMTPVATFNKDVAVMAVLKQSPYKSLEELIADAKKRPGKISVAQPVRLGYSLQAAFEFEENTGVKVENVFFDGGAAAQQAFLGGHTDVLVINGSVLRKIKQDVRPLGVMGKERVHYFPDTPTFTELGYPIEVYTYRAIVTKVGTDPAKVQLLSKAILNAVSDPDFVETMRQKGVEAFGLDAKGLTEFSDRTLDRIRKLYQKYEKKF